MNKEKINKTFFEDLHQLQMNQINTSELKQARKVIKAFDKWEATLDDAEDFANYLIDKEKK